MRESAHIALSWIRSHEHQICAQLGLGAGTHGTTTASATHVDSRPRTVEAHRGVGVGESASLLFPVGFLTDMDVHLHFPAGGVPKDGPSAGTAITSALLSLLLGRAIDPAVAMTGEVSSGPWTRGRVYSTSYVHTRT